MRNLSLWFVVLICAISSMADAQEKKDKKEQAYVGAKKCKLCHSSAKMADTSYKTWAKAKHAKAFEVLKTDKAKEAAKKHGIDDPTTAKDCLKCHTTPTLKPEESVSCERCHGKASLWLKPHGKKKKEARPNHEELKKLGKNPVWEKDFGKKLCVECHKEDKFNDFYKPFDYDKAWAKIAHGKKAEEKKSDKKEEKK